MPAALGLQVDGGLVQTDAAAHNRAPHRHDFGSQKKGREIDALMIAIKGQFAGFADKTWMGHSVRASSY